MIDWQHYARLLISYTQSIGDCKSNIDDSLHVHSFLFMPSNPSPEDICAMTHKQLWEQIPWPWVCIVFINMFSLFLHNLVMLLYKLKMIMGLTHKRGDKRSRSSFAEQKPTIKKIQLYLRWVAHALWRRAYTFGH